MRMTIASSPLEPRRGWLHGAIWRVRQFGHAVRSRPDPAVDSELRRLLASDAQWELLARLTPFDRAHHLRVYRLLADAGQDDPDLLRAALLHDSGKAAERGRVGVVHRAVYVLVGRVSPALLDRLASHDDRFRHGIWLSLRHAEIGAELVRDAGGSERCCDLIRRHNDRSASDDPLLAALIADDHAAIR
ncbi:MAG TPA: HD domain-containing protein [Thermomicrobiales bacterium]|nr:HD domain-containing protein [Thermomicrobiales bacterium]